MLCPWSWLGLLFLLLPPPALSKALLWYPRVCLPAGPQALLCAHECGVGRAAAHRQCVQRCPQTGLTSRGSIAAYCGCCQNTPPGGLAAGFAWHVLPVGSASFSSATVGVRGPRICDARRQLAAQLTPQPLGVACARLVSRVWGAPAGSVAPCCRAELTSCSCWNDPV